MNIIIAEDQVQADNYRKYRGKCKEMSEALVAENPELRLVRGHYFCPLWGTEEPHWWCVDKDGKIHDPTKLQFPSAGHGMYEEFNGMCTCSNCGNEVPEAEAVIGGNGNHAFCNHTCYGRYIGVY